MTIDTIGTHALRVPLLAALLFAGSAWLGGAAQAQTSDLPDPGMLPDNPLYFAKSMTETVGTLFTFGEANEAERALKLSEKRLAEARALAADGKSEEAVKAVDRYEAQLHRAVTKAERARTIGNDRGEALGQVIEATSRHQAVLSEVHGKVPEQARPGIQRAMEASRRGHAQASQARTDAPGRLESPGRPGSRGKGHGPPDSRDTERPNRGERGPPDSVQAGKPDSTVGR